MGKKELGRPLIRLGRNNPEFVLIFNKK